MDDAEALKSPFMLSYGQKDHYNKLILCFVFAFVALTIITTLTLKASLEAVGHISLNLMKFLENIT